MPEVQSKKQITFKARTGWQDTIALENFGLFKEYGSASNTFRQNALKMEDARFLRHFSEGERRELLAFRQAPLPIGISTAILDTADALLVNSKPIINVAPIIHPNEEDTQISRNVASIFQFLIQNSWHESLGSLQYERAVFDKGNVGHGLMYAVPRSETGEFTVDVKHLSWRYYFPDPSSKDPLYRDMDAMIYAMPLTLKQAYKFVKAMEPDLKYDTFKKDFQNQSGNRSSVLGYFADDKVVGSLKLDDTILFILRLSLEDEKYWVLTPTDKFQDNGALRYSTVGELTPELLKAEAEGFIKLTEKNKLCLTEAVSIGEYGYKLSYPIGQYNIVPLVEKHRGNPYPYSKMWNIYPLQRALNRSIMSSLLNMSLMNATRVIAEENSVVNMKEWVTNASMPGVLLRYKLPIPGYSKPPEVVEPKPMGEAWLTFPKFIISMMEYVSGIYGVMAGNPDQAPDVFSSLASLQGAGNLRIKKDALIIDAALSTLGEVIGEFYKEYAPPQGYSSYHDPIDGKEIVQKYNELSPNLEKSDEGTIKASLVIKPETDLSKGFKKVRFTTQASLGSEAATEAAMLTTLATQMKIPELVPPALERMNLRNISKILEEIDQNKNLRSAVAQMEETVKKLNAESTMKEHQIFQLAKGLEAAKVKGLLDQELVKFKADPVGYLNQAMTNQGDH